jgi:hypothetical protein
MKIFNYFFLDLKVAINHQHTADFPHRLPFNAAELVTVKGEVNLTTVHIYPGMGGHHGQPWRFAKETPVPMNVFPGKKNSSMDRIS